MACVDNAHYTENAQAFPCPNTACGQLHPYPYFNVVFGDRVACRRRVGSVHALLLECNRRGVAEYPLRDHLTGMSPGCEHQGKPLAPMREKSRSPLVLLLGCPVDPRLGERTRIGVYHSRPENHAQTFKPKESVA
jgi:hypothetical protein